MAGTIIGMKSLGQASKEIAAIDRAQKHAKNKSFTWKDHVKNFNTFLRLELGDDLSEEEADTKSNVVPGRFTNVTDESIEVAWEETFDA